MTRHRSPHHFAPSPSTPELPTRPGRRRSIGWVALLALVALLLPSTALASGASASKDGGRFYQVVLVYVKDAAKYGEYVQALGPVVSRYGARADRVLVPSLVFPEDLGQPDFVNVVSYDSEEAFRRFEHDPDFRALQPLRDAAITLRGLNARALGAPGATGDPAGRPYMLELVHYRDDDPRAFEHYRRTATPVMARHGFHTELRLEPLEILGDFELPDAVAVHYFDTEEGKTAAENDPRHGEIEALYGEAIEGLVWIEGQALSR